MPDDRSTPRVMRTLMSVASLVIIIAGLRAAEAILVPFLVSAFFAVVCAPPMKWLQARRFPKVAAVFTVVIGFAAAAVLVVGLIGTSVNDFISRRAEYQRMLTVQKDAAVDWIEQFLKGRGVKIDESGSQSTARDGDEEDETDRGINVEKTINEAIAQMGIEPARLLKVLGDLLGSLGNMFGNASLILLTLIFILLEASGFDAKIAKMPGDTQERTARMHQILIDIRHYVSIKTWLSLLTGMLATIILLLCSVEYAYMWGLIAFLFNYVPNIGSIIAAVPPVLLTFLTHGPVMALVVAGGYVLINVGVGYGIEPRVTGQGVGLSPLVVFLSLVFWGWVLGPMGMVLSVPLTMVAKIYLDRAEETRWIAILLGGDVQPES